MTEGMNVKDYDYDLPEELIAQDPLEDRSSSRLMVLDRQTGDVEHRHFTDILEYLHPGDCLVINNTKVIPARLFGVKEDTQAKIEVHFLLLPDGTCQVRHAGLLLRYLLPYPLLSAAVLS